MIEMLTSELLANSAKTHIRRSLNGAGHSTRLLGPDVAALRLRLVYMLRSNTEAMSGGGMGMIAK